jgi:RimJ/RimL family protein N-acetyltransferase
MITPARLPTEQPDLVLRELTADDAAALHALTVANAAHLTRHGEFTDEVSRSLTEVQEYFANPPDSHLRYGIWWRGSLVGRIDLVPVDPPRYSMGYWLAEHATGRGLATAAARAIIELAEQRLGATDILAGVTHGNVESVAVLERAGLTAITRFETYTRFHRSLNGDFLP